jgi:hypothetical protein
MFTDLVAAARALFDGALPIDQSDSLLSETELRGTPSGRLYRARVPKVMQSLDRPDLATDIHP